ncbi:hypothetical protein [Desulfosporosinus shakirovi]|uniref:hypothetical protein n=1 Tax=Desulfosporosinus shakirovi TaxID=2885154 RepID=UPI001E63959B|nr:hypothetical protein [Desulfosporosinus sp. SRJS8]MCB8814943.1 hypothetical protein [Desulfosporosinus sp. SRJS8]
MLWLFLGIVIGFILSFVILKVKAGQLSVKWYQWVLASVSVVLLLLTIENYLGLKMELETYASNFVLLAMGLPAVVLGALIWIIPLIAKKRKPTSDGQKLTA